jgi:hypothetical protein
MSLSEIKIDQLETELVAANAEFRDAEHKAYVSLQRLLAAARTD